MGQLSSNRPYNLGMPRLEEHNTGLMQKTYTYRLESFLCKNRLISMSKGVYPSHQSLYHHNWPGQSGNVKLYMEGLCPAKTYAVALKKYGCLPH